MRPEMVTIIMKPCLLQLGIRICMLGVGFLLKTLPSGTQEQGDTHSLKVVRVRVLQITPENPWPLVVAAILNGVLSAKGALQEGREWCGELPVSDLGFLQAVVRKIQCQSTEGTSTSYDSLLFLSDV